MAATTTCAGCGFEAAAVEGPTHAYIGASPACWSVFVRALVEKLGSVTAGPLLGDAYAVQHPGVPERRAVQSVGVHLVTLCAALEGGWSPRHLVDVRRRAAAAPEGFWTWLGADTPLGTMTIADVLAPEDPAARAELVPVYVDDVWRAYRDVHDTVREWTSALLHRRCRSLRATAAR